MAKKGSVLITLGLLLIAAALCLTGYNYWDSARAGQESADVLSEMAAVIPQPHPAADFAPEEQFLQQFPEREMPTLTINGYRYIGYLEIPDLELKLPVMEEWSYKHLNIAPCRFSGNLYQDNLVICGHNFSTHFSGLKSAPLGTKVLFTDAEGAVYVFRTASVETLGPDDEEAMTRSEWPLTLFTCTTGGQTRYTVRCERAD